MLHEPHSDTESKHLSTRQQHSTAIFITAVRYLSMSVWSMIMAPMVHCRVNHLLMAEWCNHNDGHDGSQLYIVREQQQLDG